MKHVNRRILCILVATLPLPSLALARITLGTAADFAVLGGSTVSNTGLTFIGMEPLTTGGADVGVYPGTSITGFPPGTLIPPASLHPGDAVASAAQRDLVVVYNAAAALTQDTVLSGQNLGGLTLTPGVYYFAASADLTGQLILDGQNNPNAEFVFQIGSTLISATGAQVTYINAAPGSDADCSVYWQIGTSATLGTNTQMLGHLLASASITLNTGVALQGSALALSGAVTLDTNTITNCGKTTQVPEPSFPTLLLPVAFVALTSRSRR